MKILVACEESQAVCIAFREKGHEAYSCDILACSGGHPEWHIQGDVLEQLDKDWDMMIAHPPCDYLTVTGNKWFKDQQPRKSGALVGQDRRDAREEAVEFFKKIHSASIPKIIIENPVGIMSTRLRKPDQIICPTMFGHVEPKKTCLWLKGANLLVATDQREGDYIISKSGKRLARWYYEPSPSPERKKMRSVTFPGIAKAMAEQWG